MIEFFIKNKITLAKYRRFKTQKLAVFSLWALLIMGFFSTTAEFWANSKPLLLKYKGTIYFPVVKDYHPSLLGIESGELVIDYRKLELSEADFALWPIIHWDPYESNTEVASYPAPPSKQNLLGTDDRGRDVLTRIVYGFRYSMAYALLVWFLSSILGVILGGIMGYFGGMTDLLGQRFVEILSTIPRLPLLMILIMIFQPSLMILVAVTLVFEWIMISYYVRGEFLKYRKREFVEAARSLGAKTSRIIFKHILPNSWGPVITFSPFIISTNVQALATLDFLGFGLMPPTPSWGELLNQAQKYFTIAWWLAVYPSLFLFATLVLLALVGDGIRDALNPKKH